MIRAALCAALAACGSKSEPAGPPSGSATPSPSDAAPRVVDAAAPDASIHVTGLAELAKVKGSADALFAHELGVAGDQVLASAPLAGNGYVTVYAEVAGTWKQVQKLVTHTEELGESLAVDGDTLAVGAVRDNGDRGAVFVFERTAGTWKQTAKLVAPVATYQFGKRVALSGDTLVVGVPWDRGTTSTASLGTAYVFERANGAWKQTAKLVAPKRTKGELFGWDVAIAGDRIAVGALGAKESAAAYVFERGADRAWTCVATLTPHDATAHDGFASHLALAGDGVVVSAPADVGGYVSGGAVYVFRKSADGFQETQKLQPAESRAFDYYGEAIAAHESQVAVGAYGMGAAYLYEYDRGTLVLRTQVDGGKSFAATAALDDDHAAIGLLGDSSSGFRIYAIRRNANSPDR